MFHDKRSKKVVFIAHCLLNQNSISDGTAVYPAAFKEVIDFFLNSDVGIVLLCWFRDRNQQRSLHLLSKDLHLL